MHGILAAPARGYNSLSLAVDGCQPLELSSLANGMETADYKEGTPDVIEVYLPACGGVCDEIRFEGRLGLANALTPWETMDGVRVVQSGPEIEIGQDGEVLAGYRLESPPPAVPTLTIDRSAPRSLDISFRN